MSHALSHLTNGERLGLDGEEPEVERLVVHLNPVMLVALLVPDTGGNLRGGNAPFLDHLRGCYRRQRGM